MVIYLHMIKKVSHIKPLFKEQNFFPGPLSTLNSAVSLTYIGCVQTNTHNTNKKIKD